MRARNCCHVDPLTGPSVDTRGLWSVLMLEVDALFEDDSGTEVMSEMMKQKGV